MTDLEKIDLIRERAGVGYRRAQELLQEASGDVVKAMVLAEEQDKPWKETMQVKGSELVDQVREIIKEGNVTKIRVKHKGKTIVELPVTIGAAGVLIAPQLAVIGVLTALLTKCTLEIERNKAVENRADSPETK